MPDPLLSPTEVEALATLYEMGAVWTGLDAAGRMRVYRSAEAQWRALRWHDTEDPFSITALPADLQAALADHLRYDAGLAGSADEQPFPLTTNAIIRQRLMRGMTPRALGGGAAPTGGAAIPVSPGAPGLTEQQIEALIAAAILQHAGMANIHHTPPRPAQNGGVTYEAGSGSTDPSDSTERVWAADALADFTEARVNEEVESWAQDGTAARIPDAKMPTSFLDNTAITQLVAQAILSHAGMPNIHHTPPAAGGGGSELSAQASPPDAAGASDGDIVNVAGDLFVFVPSSEAPNRLYFHTSTDAGGYRGVRGGDGPEFEWVLADPSTSPLQRMRIPKSTTSVDGRLSGGAPATIWVTYANDAGYDLLLIQLNRDTGRDTADKWGYASATTGDRIPNDAQIAPVGSGFSITLYTSAARTQGIALERTGRWERKPYELSGTHGRLLADPDLLDADGDDGDIPVFYGGNQRVWGTATFRDGQGVRARWDSAQAAWMFDLAHSGLFTTLEDDTQGIAITSTASSVQQSLTAFTDQALTLMPSDRGLMLINIDWSVSPGSEAQLSLDEDVRDVETIFLSALAASDAYDSAEINGIKVGSVDIVEGQARRGTVSFYVARNASNQVGWYMEYSPNAGFTLSATSGSLSAEFRIVLLRSDAPAAAGGAEAARTAVGTVDPALNRSSVDITPTLSGAAGKGTLIEIEVVTETGTSGNERHWAARLYVSRGAWDSYAGTPGPDLMGTAVDPQNTDDGRFEFYHVTVGQNQNVRVNRRSGTRSANYSSDTTVTVYELR